MSQLRRSHFSRSNQTTPTQNTPIIETREQLQRSSKIRANELIRSAEYFSSDEEETETENESEEEETPRKAMPSSKRARRGCGTPTQQDEELDNESNDDAPPAKKPHHQPPIKKDVTENPSTPKLSSNNFVQQSPLPKPEPINKPSASKISETPSTEIRLQHDCKWWQEMIKNNPFFDVLLIAASNVEIQSHRVLLAKYSPILANVFKVSKDIPVRIQMKDFDSVTIRAALDFMLDKFDSMKGKELSVLKLAIKYNITDLMKFCCSDVEKSVDGSNVVEIIQIAYSNNFESLKQKCLKVLAENKDSVKFDDLPKCILIDVIRFLK